MKSIDKLFKHAIKISNDEEFRKVPFTAQEIGEIVSAMISGKKSIIFDMPNLSDALREVICNFCIEHNLQFEISKPNPEDIYDSCKIHITWYNKFKKE